MKLYLAGPMTGYPDFNFPAFERAAQDLRKQGYIVWSPHESDLEAAWAASHRATYDPANGDPGSSTELSHRYFLAEDLRHVCAADEVAVLDGWESSLGARIETYVAFQLGIPVKPYEEGVPFEHAHHFNRFIHPHISRES